MEKPSSKRTRDLGDIQAATKAEDHPSGKTKRLEASDLFWQKRNRQSSSGHKRRIDLMEYGNKNYFVEKFLIVFFILWGIATIFNVAYSAELEIIPVQQKVLPNGNAYGLESGIYFKLTDLQPFIMYKLQYSEDLKKWKDLVQLGTYKMAMTSPYYTWDQLPKNKCFFRIVEAW